MGDVIPYKAVFHKTPEGQPDRLYLATRQGDWRDIPVHPAPHVGKELAFKYVDGNTLEITPSLLCLDTQFHTDYTWRVEYVTLPEGEEPVRFFRKVNPNWELGAFDP